MTKRSQTGKRKCPPSPPISSTDLSEKTRHRGRQTDSALNQRIMQMVVEIIATEGNARCTMDEIARRTGIPKSTIYRRWPSKGALLVQTYLSMLRRFRKKIDTGSLQKDMEAAIGGDIAAIRDTRIGRMAISIMMEAQMSDEIATLMREKTVMPLRQARKEMLQRGIPRGEVVPGVDLEVAMDMQFGAVWYRILSGSAPLDDDLARRVAAQQSKSLRAPRRNS